MQIVATLAGYRSSLLAPPPPVATLMPLDAVQEFGQGIGSFPRVRALALARGPSTAKGDDVILEIKELPPQNGSSLPVTSSFASPGERVLASLAAGWTERGADPLWGVGDWAGFPVQVRTESGGFKTLRIGRLDGDLGTPEALIGLGAVLARLIARMHAAPLPTGGTPAGAIADDIAADPDGFADEQADIAISYCDRVLSDWMLFQQAMALLGPTLGISGDPAHAHSPDIRTLFDPHADPTAAGIDPVMGPIAINEIVATGTEYVELTNASAAMTGVADYRVADSDVDGGPRLDQATALSGAAALPAGGKIVVVGGYKTPATGPQDNCTGNISPCFQAGWDIAASNGETIYLLSPDDIILDQARYPANAAPIGHSWARVPDGQGRFTAGSPSPGQTNPGPP
jgi:hypothetical protein